MTIEDPEDCPCTTCDLDSHCVETRQACADFLFYLRYEQFRRLDREPRPEWYNEAFSHGDFAV